MAVAMASSQAMTTTGLNLGTPVPIPASSAITVTTGDVMVIKLTMEDSGSTLDAPTITGQVVTFRASDLTASHCAVYVYTCVISGSPGTVTLNSISKASGVADRAMAVIERWTGSQLAATPATNATRTAGTANGFTGSVTTAAAGSGVSWAAGDWSANAPGTPGYLSSAAQTGLQDQSPGAYVGYSAYQIAGAAGAQSFGLTTPVATGTWNFLAIEVQASGAVVPSSTQPLIREFAIQRAARW